MYVYMHLSLSPKSIVSVSLDDTVGQLATYIQYISLIEHPEI